MTDIPLGEATAVDDILVIGQRPQIRNPFSITTFLKELDKRGGPLTSNLFTVQIILPSNIRRADDDRIASLFCEAAPMPGLSLGTDDTIQRYGYGPTHRAVWGTVFTGFNMEFIVDAKGTIPAIFTKWIDSIVNFNDSEHIMQANATGYPFMISYHDEYASTMKVFSHDSLGNKVIATTYYDVFPTRLVEGQLSNSALNGYVKLTVSFSSTRWTTEFLDLDDGENDALTAANERVTTQLYTNDAQVGAAELNTIYNSVTATPTSISVPAITDTILTNTNGIIAGNTNRTPDSNFDVNILFF